MGSSAFFVRDLLNLYKKDLRKCIVDEQNPDYDQDVEFIENEYHL